MFEISDDNLKKFKNFQIGFDYKNELELHQILDYLVSKNFIFKRDRSSFLDELIIDRKGVQNCQKLYICSQDNFIFYGEKVFSKITNYIHPFANETTIQPNNKLKLKLRKIDV